MTHDRSHDPILDWSECPACAQGLSAGFTRLADMDMKPDEAGQFVDRLRAIAYGATNEGATLTLLKDEPDFRQALLEHIRAPYSVAYDSRWAMMRSCGLLDHPTRRPDADPDSPCCCGHRS